MIGSEDARRIAEQFLAQKAGHCVSSVYAYDEVPGRKPLVYWPSATPLKETWIAYVDRFYSGPSSCEIVVVSMRDGAILYHGSAFDEG
jgi:hypothetical protein